ncbi:rab11 family-interacting protein 3 [Ascaphus truei]|uniref:rab11 family-interacting protein 3 n=1 Tax=Ascaphus truei TaxID=8439 RepID=UPI003F5A26E9
MRMERGHLRTAWGLGGSLDADYLEGQHMGPTGGLTCPQQVGGSFLVQKWEGPASLQPRLEEQDEQGEIMPEPEESSLLPQGLQGTGRGQVGETVGGGHWVGDECGRFNLYTLDWTPQSAQMPLSQIHLPPESDQMPQSQTNLPLETNQMPLSQTYLPPETRKMLLSQTILPHKKDQLPLYSGSPFQSEQLPLSETTLPHDSDQLPQLTVVSPLETGQMPQFITSLPPEIGRMPQFAWSLALQRDLMPISPASLPPETQKLPLSGNCLTHNGEQLPLSDICLPHDTDRLPLFPLDSFVDSYQLPQSNNTLPHETEQLPIFTWDWALSTDPMPLPVTDLPPEAGKLPLCDAEDPFSIFRLDTPLESEQLSPETAGLSLSADLQSLSDLFSCMVADQLPPSQKDRDPLYDVTGQLPLSQVDTVLETEQLPPINVTAPLPLSQSHVPLETDQSPILGTPGQLPCTQADLPHESRQLPLPSVSDQLPLIHSDQLAFSCLVREPGRGPLLNGTDQPPLYHVDTLLEAGQLPQSCKRSPYKTDYLPPPDAADQIPQSELDSPLKRNRLPPKDVTDQQALCISDSYYEPHLLAQSLSASPIETCQLPLSDSDSLTESNQLPHAESDTPREINQLPLIVVTDSFDLLDQSSENTPLPSSNAKKQLPRSRADLLLETSQLPLAQVDTPLQTALFPPGDTTGQFSQSDPLHDSTQLPSRDVTGQMSQMDSPFENTHLPPFSAPSQLPLSQTDSPLEPTQLPRCDVTTPHQPADPPLPAVPCATPLYGEGDLDSGLPLDAGPSGFGDELSRLRAVFDALDRDKDGFVKMEDFVQFATVYGAEQVKELTGYLDPAGLGVINFRDFYRGISEIQNEDLDMQLYDMGYPTEEEPPACSVDFDDFAAYEVRPSVLGSGGWKGLIGRCSAG